MSYSKLGCASRANKEVKPSGFKPLKEAKSGWTGTYRSTLVRNYTMKNIARDHLLSSVSTCSIYKLMAKYLNMRKPLLQ